MAMFHIDAKDESALWAFFANVSSFQIGPKKPEFRS